MFVPVLLKPHWSFVLVSYANILQADCRITLDTIIVVNSCDRSGKELFMCLRSQDVKELFESLIKHMNVTFASTELAHVRHFRQY